MDNLSANLLDEFADLVESRFGTHNFICAIIRIRRKKYATGYRDALSDELEKALNVSDERPCDSICAEEGNRQ